MGRYRYDDGDREPMAMVADRKRDIQKKSKLRISDRKEEPCIPRKYACILFIYF